jgi:hypothetical protein
MRTFTTFACLALLTSGLTAAQADPQLEVIALPSPSGENALYPWLDHGPGRGLSASWTERLSDGGVRMMWSRWADDHWTEAEEIVSGKKWFVNWADHPVHAADGQGNAIATWLKKVKGSPYAYHVQVRQRDGKTGEWGDIQRLHSDTSAGEHGFVSLDYSHTGAFMAVWLDGRETTQGGAMQLWGRRIPIGDSKWGPETLLDDRVCDCCSTSLRINAKGQALVTYRDRSGLEVRDIGWIQLPASAEADWSKAPRGMVFPDQWTIPGCPVNGPAQALLPDGVASAWFTAANQTNRVRLSVRNLGTAGQANSNTKAPSFSFPEIVAEGPSVLGRVSVAAQPNGVLVSWLQQGEEGAAWVAQLYRWPVAQPGPSNKDSEQAQWVKIGQRIQIAEVSGGRADGFLRLAPTANGWMASWTSAGSSKLACAEIRIKSGQE